MMFGASVCGYFDTLQTLRSPSAVCVASMSVFCFDEDPCHASPVIFAGDLDVLRVCRIVNDGWSVAMSIEPFMYPTANVLQSEAGAIAVIGSYIVRADMCSEVEGSNKMTLP